LILTISGWALIVVGLLGTAAQLLLVPGILAWFVIIDTIFISVSRYRAAERRTLMRCLAAAAQRGIPLHEAAHAFAMERSDELGIRAARLAELLRAGTPLSLALAQTRTRLPADALLATRLGVETGDFGGAVTAMVKGQDEGDDLVNRMLERFFYLATIACVLITILTFIMLKIVPVFAKMFEEFELELPKMTQACVAVSDFGVTYGVCFIFPMMILFAGPILHRFLSYFGATPTRVPLLSPILGRFDTALGMRAVSLAVQQQRPMAEMIGLLVLHYPTRRIRRKLRRAVKLLNSGVNWCDALRRAKIIRRSDRAVLAAAQQSGNLQWALEEMAESNMRRIAYSLHLLSNVLFPIFLVVFGLIVAFFVISLFMPLVSLIEGLA
jgi:type II secretory pathway component PulF